MATLFDKSGNTTNTTAPLTSQVGPTHNVKLFAATPKTLSLVPAIISPIQLCLHSHHYHYLLRKTSYPPPLPLHLFSNLYVVGFF